MMRDLFAGVNEPADADNLTDLETKHIPTITAPAEVVRGQPFGVTVAVGRAMPHPNERGHFIEYIDLFVDEMFLARVGLTAVGTRPEATLRVVLLAPASHLRAYSRCNIHGIWGGSVPIRMGTPGPSTA